MLLYKPYFRIVIFASRPGATCVEHNCNGSLYFRCTEEVSEETASLLNMAIEEGKRIRSREIAALIGGEPPCVN